MCLPAGVWDRYLIYPTPAEPFPLVKFREQDYLRGSHLSVVPVAGDVICADHPSDWTPILTVLLQSQAFYQFVDVRVSYSGWNDQGTIYLYCCWNNYVTTVICSQQCRDCIL